MKVPSLHNLDYNQSSHLLTYNLDFALFLRSLRLGHNRSNFINLVYSSLLEYSVSTTLLSWLIKLRDICS